MDSRDMPKANPSSQHSDLRSKIDGHKLFCQYWKPQTKPRAIVFIAHGFAEYSDYYYELADELLKQDFYVFTHDHLGHGRSDGIRGYVDKVDDYVADVVAHFKLIEEEESLPTLPYFLIGHSMGGTIAIKLALRNPDMFRGVALVSPAIITNPDLTVCSFPIMTFVARVMSKLLPLFPVSPLLYNNVSRDETRVDKMENDSLCLHGSVKARWAVAMMDALKENRKKLSTVEWPFIVMHGTGDKVCDIDGSKLLLDCAASKDKSFKVYEGAYHALFQEIEEVRESVNMEIANWISLRVRPARNAGPKKEDDVITTEPFKSRDDFD